MCPTFRFSSEFSLFVVSATSGRAAVLGEALVDTEGANESLQRPHDFSYEGHLCGLLQNQR